MDFQIFPYGTTNKNERGDTLLCTRRNLASLSNIFNNTSISTISPLVSFHAADAHTEPELAYCRSRGCLLKIDALIFFVATTYMLQRKANNVTSERLNSILHKKISISIFFLPFLPLRLMLSKKNYCVFVIEIFLGMDTAVKTGNVMHENDSNSFRIMQMHKSTKA
jgi:hypothetical protein